MKPAFSTVAFPDWTLGMVAHLAANTGALGVELRTFGDGSAEFACDPFLTSPRKTAALFDEAGAEICSVATSIRYDEPIEPPIIGRVITDIEGDIRASKAAVQLADQLQSPFVRVFGFELSGSESRRSGLRRIVERVLKSADTCRNTGVRLLIENGGSFSTAAELAELLDAADHPLIAAAYSLPVAIAAGDDPVKGANALGDRLSVIKLKSLKAGTPAALGNGDADVDAAQKAAVGALSRAGFDGWAVYEFDHAWLGRAEHVNPGEVVRESMRTLYSWIGAMTPLRRASTVRPFRTTAKM